ncbi:chlorophyll a-b binding protein 13 chloroplastic [Phtheirospermum japonicum]|uniref:Chlorophyll a-b binding protein 13 chloroplastic n=1 Tax=Phtheirospermum japonicum TaxID=374723 RepID=A0A830BNQ1_9LAMI|nr:chlorophyll a-b binding protein 13 chloroplastic [Phtheirospermum japonicum]
MRGWLCSPCLGFSVQAIVMGKGHWRIFWTILLTLLLIMLGFIPPSLFLDHKRLFLDLRLCEWRVSE